MPLSGQMSSQELGESKGTVTKVCQVPLVARNPAPILWPICGSFLRPKPVRIPTDLFSPFMVCEHPLPEPVFLNVYGAQESIPRNEFRQPISSLTGRYDNPIPTRFLAPIDCLKIPALMYSTTWLPFPS
jgi:hypothetical protein